MTDGGKQRWQVPEDVRAWYLATICRTSKRLLSRETMNRHCYEIWHCPWKFLVQMLSFDFLDAALKPLHKVCCKLWIPDEPSAMIWNVCNDLMSVHSSNSSTSGFGLQSCLVFVCFLFFEHPSRSHVVYLLCYCHGPALTIPSEI